MLWSSTRLLARTTLICALAALGWCAAGAGAAQALDDGSAEIYFVDYYDVSAGDGVVHIANPTFSATTEDSNGNASGGLLCAMIYVFDASEELQECCGCPVTNDGLRTLDLDVDLVGNPVSGSSPSDGVIKVLSSLPNHAFVNNRSPQQVCNPAINPNLTPTLRMWSTTVQSAGRLQAISEQEFQTVPLTVDEENTLINLCSTVVHQNGSGRGRCTCGTGDDQAAIPKSRHRD